MLVTQPGPLMTEKEALLLLFQTGRLTWRKYQRLSNGLVSLPEDDSTLERIFLLQSRPPSDRLQ